MNPYNAINMSQVQSQEHRDIAIKAAQMTFTLLKNDGAILPLKSKVNKMAVCCCFLFDVRFKKMVIKGGYLPKVKSYKVDYLV